MSCLSQHPLTLVLRWALAGPRGCSLCSTDQLQAPEPSGLHFQSSASGLAQPGDVVVNELASCHSWTASSGKRRYCKAGR